MKTYDDLPARCVLRSSNLKSFYEEHGQRHPASRYDLSVRKVVYRGLTLLDELEKKDDSDAWALALKAEDWFYALYEHWEDCWRILTTLIPPGEDSNLVGRFKKKTSWFTDWTAHLVNKIKHNAYKARICTIQSRKDGRSIECFFLEGAREDGAIGPVLDFHEKHGAEAFSFNRTMRLDVASLFRISDVLAGMAVEEGANFNEGECGRHDDLFELVRRVDTLDRVVLPLEATGRWVEVRVVGDKIHLDAGKKIGHISSVDFLRGDLRCNMKWKFDGVTREYCVPRRF